MMRYAILILISLTYSFNAFADNAKELRAELVKELKILFKANSSAFEYENKLIYSSLLKDISFIDSAYASTYSYDCIFGGWPSKSYQVGRKTYCTHPSNIQSPYYTSAQNNCSASQYPCPSALFGKDVCIAKRDFLNSYNKCEEKGKEPFLEDGFAGKDHLMMIEYIQIAQAICAEDNPNPKAMTLNCEKTLEKIQAYKDLHQDMVSASSSVAPLINDPDALASFCRVRFENAESTEPITVTLRNNSTVDFELDASVGAKLCEDFQVVNVAVADPILQTDPIGSRASGAIIDCPSDDAIDPVSNSEIEILTQDIMETVAYLERDRDEKNGAATRETVFAMADGVFNRQLELFNEANDLDSPASREDNFLIRTVKDPALNEDEFKRRANLIKIAINEIERHYRETGDIRMSLSTLTINRLLRENGLEPRSGEARYISYIFMNMDYRFRQNWKVLEKLAPQGDASVSSNVIAKLGTIKNIANKALDDNQTIKADEFYYYSYFMASPEQQTTVFVQPENGGAYLPFKETRPIEGPSLSSAISSKLFQGDVKQPEGFMDTYWGGASDNVASSDYSAAMYYRTHVNYGSDESESDRNRLRQTLRSSGMTGSKGGDIRIHADVGSIGCLELPIEDSTAITGLTRDGARPKMETIPFEFTPENLQYFGNKIEGHGEFWKSIAEHENDNFRFESATPISTLLNQNTSSVY